MAGLRPLATGGHTGAMDGPGVDAPVTGTGGSTGGGTGAGWTNPGRLGRPTGPGGHPLAEWWERLLGRLLDNLIVGVPGAVLASAWVVTLGIGLFRDDPDWVRDGPPGWVVLWYFLLFPALGLVGAISSYVYHVMLFGGTGRTVGKRVLRLAIVDAGSGGPVTVAQLRRRWLAYDAVIYVGLLLLPLSVVASPYSYLCVLWALWDQPDRQTLHDKYSRTVVVREDS